MKYEEPEMCVAWVKKEDVIVTSLTGNGDVTDPSEENLSLGNSDLWN